MIKSARVGRRPSKRQDIVQAALMLLGTAGLEGFSAAALAEAAGVSKATLFHHFETLDDIVLESFEQYAQGLEMVRPPVGTGFRDWLEGMAGAAFGLREADDPLTRAYISFVAKALFDERLRARLMQTVALMCEAFADAVAETYPGPLSRDEVRAMGWLIFMSGDGLALHLHAFPERREGIFSAWAILIDRLVPRAGAAQP